MRSLDEVRSGSNASFRPTAAHFRFNLETDVQLIRWHVSNVPEAEVIGAFGHGVESLPTTARGTLRAIL